MKNKTKLKIIPLGGLCEIGKNITVFEYGGDILVLDCGLAFPDEEMFGVDLVIPDTSYLVKNKDKIKGIVLTHGHEDHIGALPYLLREVSAPIYGTNMTLGLVKLKLKEHRLLDSAKIKPVKPGDTVNLGPFKVEFIHVNHSIPDAVAMAITTPVGVILHTGDYKIDTAPIDDDMINLGRISELGKKGILLMMGESTNVERTGYSLSESSLAASFTELFDGCTKRIIIATFASNVHRIQQIINAAHRNKRKVAVSGRSMDNVITVANDLGYIKIPKGTLISLDEINRYSPEQLVIITTGSQGETMSALTRMAFADHRKVVIGANDRVIISASPIPGNEKDVSKVINELYKKEAEVIYDTVADIHVSGHAFREELKLMLKLARPKLFVPVHGEYRHLKQHALLAQETGVDKKNITILDIGQVLEVDGKSAKVTETVQAGKIMVDGLGVGDVGNIVLRDRKHLAEDGLIVVVVGVSSQTGIVTAGPDIISRGFVYVREAEDLMEASRECVRKALSVCAEKHVKDWNSLKHAIKNSLGQYIYEQTKRKPMILPVIMEENI